VKGWGWFKAMRHASFTINRKKRGSRLEHIAQKKREEKRPVAHFGCRKVGARENDFPWNQEFPLKLRGMKGFIHAVLPFRWQPPRGKKKRIITDLLKRIQ